MIATLHRASEMLALRVRVRDDVEQARGLYDFGKVVTQNEATRRVLEVARKAAETDHTTILLQEESGTGKSVFAKAIHYASPRASMPLLEINCAALSDTLLESELFGFEPGAFTDAAARKACSNARTGEPCFSMRSPQCRPVCRLSSCACSKRAPSCGSVARAR